MGKLAAKKGVADVRLVGLGPRFFTVIVRWRLLRPHGLPVAEVGGQTTCDKRRRFCDEREVEAWADHVSGQIAGGVCGRGLSAVHAARIRGQGLPDRSRVTNPGIGGGGIHFRGLTPVRRHAHSV